MKRNNNAGCIGVIGATGNLGGKLCIQLLASGFTVIAYRRDVQKSLNATRGVDLVTKLEDAHSRVRWVDTIAEVAIVADIMHWCAPLSAISTPHVARWPYVVLHDSVMANSIRAAEQLRQHNCSVGTVHCLMNAERAVVINESSDNFRLVDEHFAAMGMVTHSMQTQAHDLMMAHSQAPFAIMCKLLLDDLEQYAASGLLTPSGQALRRALEDRSARWTKETFKTILSNPELKGLIASMRRIIEP